MPEFGKNRCKYHQNGRGCQVNLKLECDTDFGE
jgi:hypothetical protein